MPRLTDEQIKQAILHDDIELRTTAVRYFKEAASPDPTVMPVVIEALGRFGLDKALRRIYLISYLAQTEATVRWALDELRTLTPTGAARDAHDALCRLLAFAEPALVVPHEAEIVGVLGFPERLRDLIRKRCAFTTWETARLEQELEAFCERWKGEFSVDKVPYHEGRSLVEELARRTVPFTDEMMAVLRETHDDPAGTPLLWREPLLIYLAGLLRHEPAIPHLVNKLDSEDDLLPDLCATALGQIGTDEVLRALRKAFDERKTSLHLFASGVIEKIHSDASVQVGVEMFEREDDPDYQHFMAAALCQLFSSEANEAIYKTLGSKLAWSEAKEDFVCSCLLLGQDFPELATWRAEIDAMWKRVETIEKAPLSRPVPRPAARPGPKPLPPILSQPRLESRPAVGRNDPCPCGSGKKYKKCCLNKAT